MSNLERPQQFDAVLGTQQQVSPGSVILGGIEAVKTRLNSDNIRVVILALKDAMNYGELGLEIVVGYLEDEEPQIAIAAYELLAPRSETFVRDRVQRYLDDRELELQEQKYSWLESSPEVCTSKQFKAQKKSKNTADRQTHSRSSKPSQTRWNDAS